MGRRFHASMLPGRILRRVENVCGGAQAIIRRFGLPEDTLSRPSVEIASDDLRALTEAASEACADPMLGVHTALDVQRGSLGLVEYLTRSISALYAYHGGVFLLMATDIRRYRDLALYFGLGDMVFGAVVFAIGLYAGLPPIWLWGEGPPTVLIGLVIAWLARRIPTEERPRPG